MSDVRYIDSQMVWEERMGEKVLRLTRDELYLDFPFLSAALSFLIYTPDKRLVTTATDGERLYYPPEKLLIDVKENPVYLSRLYLHSVLHCMYAHLWLRGDRDTYLWGIACDIAVEFTIDHLSADSVVRTLSGIRKRLYSEFERDDRPVSAASVYRVIERLSIDEVKVLYREFIADDHVLWPKEKRLDEKQALLMQRWSDVGKKSETKRRRLGDDESEGTGSISYQVKRVKARRTYSEFLREFMVLREELRTDPDEFDIGYYMYGLSIYKNMPIIEPIETRESHRIRDFVVAVDTSYSTSGELIQRFLRETLSILSSEDNFFRESKLHLIQADDRVQSDVVLTSESQIEALFDSFEVAGGGNTDFRPVFDYVSRLAKDGEFDKLSGLIYFTDGRGTYPTVMPDYKVAFVFLDEYEKEKVPPWAMKIEIELD